MERAENIIQHENFNDWKNIDFDPGTYLGKYSLWKEKNALCVEFYKYSTFEYGVFAYVNLKIGFRALLLLCKHHLPKHERKDIQPDFQWAVSLNCKSFFGYTTKRVVYTTVGISKKTL